MRLVFKILKKGMIGFLIGTSISYLITIIISLCMKDGNFYPVVPQFLSFFKTEINAVFAQYLLSGLSGFIIGSATLIWESEKLSLLFQTVLHFFCISIAIFPIAWICYWMHHSLSGVLSYILEFVLIYIVIWVVCYFKYFFEIKNLNKKLKH